MSEVIIKHRWLKEHRIRRHNKFDILYRDSFISIEGDYDGSYFTADLTNNNHPNLIVDGEEAKQIITETIKMLKDLDSKYIPTLMRLTALKETL